MIKRQLVYAFIILSIMGFIIACSGNTEKSASEQSGESADMTGAEILIDAKDYAEKQCYYTYEEALLTNDPEVIDFDLKMKKLKMERKKIKNFYLKKYKDNPVEKVAFQRAVKAARQDSEYCNKVLNQSIK